MVLIELRRLAYDPSATPGLLLLNGELFCYTLEPPWRDNKPNVSCIPEGRYRLKFEQSFSFALPEDKGGALRLFFHGVQDRSRCLFHWGNWVRNTKGCVITGSGVSGSPALDVEYSVSRSKAAMRALEAAVRESPGFKADGVIEIDVVGPAVST